MPRLIRLKFHNGFQLLLIRPLVTHEERTTVNNDIDLLGQDIDEDVENLPDGNAVGSWSSAATAGSASCPASSASTFTSASSYG